MPASSTCVAINKGLRLWLLAMPSVLLRMYKLAFFFYLSRPREEVNSAFTTTEK